MLIAIKSIINSNDKTVHNGKNLFIIAGTTLVSGKGGISTSLRGLVEGFSRKSVPYVFIATHDPNARFRQFLPFLRSLPEFIYSVVHGKRFYNKVYVYVHPGPSISLVRKYLLLILGRFLGCITISQLHSSDTDKYLQHPLKKFFLRQYYAVVGHIFVLTPWWKNRLLSEGIGDGRISIIPNIIEPCLMHNLFQGLYHTHATSDGTVNILSMTRFVDGKGVDSVIKAFKFLPSHYRLTLAGDGPNRLMYEDMAASEGVMTRVSFEGWVDEPRKAELFSAATIFCLPSKHDSFGMVFVEAMSHGVPVIALNYGPIADVVPDGIVGTLVEDAAPYSLARAITSLAEDPDILAKREACKDWVKSMYTPDKVMDKILEALKL